MKQRYL